MPKETYIGVSGLMLAPKGVCGCWYLGQMQHMVGCNRATTLFAINKDKNAPIFKAVRLRSGGRRQDRPAPLWLPLSK